MKRVSSINSLDWNPCGPQMQYSDELNPAYPFLTPSTCGHCHSWEDFGPHQERSRKSQSSADDCPGWSEMNGFDFLTFQILSSGDFQWVSFPLTSLCPAGWQTPVSGLCGHDGRDTELPLQTEADSALLRNFPPQCAEVYGWFLLFCFTHFTFYPHPFP